MTSTKHKGLHMSSQEWTTKNIYTPPGLYTAKDTNIDCYRNTLDSSASSERARYLPMSKATPKSNNNEQYKSQLENANTVVHIANCD